MESFLVYLFNFYYAISELEQNKQNNTIFFFTIYFFNKKVNLGSLRGGAGAPIAPPLPTGLHGTLYSNISSCIINNGFTSDYFAVGRGVRQGDPLSPVLLFILGLEILACSIRKNDKIQGIQIDNSEVKLTLFADDLTCFLCNRSSYDCLRDCLYTV